VFSGGQATAEVRSHSHTLNVSYLLYPNPEPSRNTETTGPLLQTWCNACRLTVVIGSINMCNIRTTRGEVCLLMSIPLALLMLLCPGVWSSEEEGQLLHAIHKLTWQGKSQISARGFWVSVSGAMGGTWAPKQCQGKWCVPDSSCILLYSCDLQVQHT